MAVIQARGLAKRYQGKAAVVGLSFDVLPGKVTGFLGPNGSGKSTTMRLMLELDRGEGTCTFDGRAFSQYVAPMREVGSLLEAKPFHPTRSARNHLRMLAAASKIPDSRCDQVLNIVGLSDVGDKKPSTFSLGMGQRLGLAAALLGDPHTLILDEPANGLDPQGIRWMRDLLKQLAAEGRSVFVSSHLLSEMSLMADELVVIGRGQMIANGPVEEFTKRASANFAVVKTPQARELATLITGELAGSGSVTANAPGELQVRGLDLRRIGDLAFDAGIRLHELTESQASLEDAFLEMTSRAEEFQGRAPVTSGPPPGFGPGGGPGPGFGPGFGPGPGFGAGPDVGPGGPGGPVAPGGPGSAGGPGGQSYHPGFHGGPPAGPPPGPPQQDRPPYQAPPQSEGGQQ